MVEIISHESWKLTVQNRYFILKCLHQGRFLEIFEKFSAHLNIINHGNKHFLAEEVKYCRCLTFAFMKCAFPGTVHSVSSLGNFLAYNNMLKNIRKFYFLIFVPFSEKYYFSTKKIQSSPVLKPLSILVLTCFRSRLFNKLGFGRSFSFLN